MTKNEYLSLLEKGLSGRMQEWEIKEHINFYSEAIDDRMEEGLSEEDSVLDMGCVEKVISDICGEPYVKSSKDRKPKRKLRAFEIVLLILGSPLWISLLAAAFAIIISLFAALWSVTVSMWSVFVSFIGGSVGALLAGILFIIEGIYPSGISMIAAALLLCGLSIFAFFGCRALTKGSAWLTCKTAVGIKKLFSKKEGA